MKEFIFDEKKHVYTLDGKKLYGITNILSVISKPALIQWAANEAVKYIDNNRDLFTEGRGKPPKEYLVLDPEKFSVILGEAKTAHRKKKEDAADAGTNIHSKIEEYIELMITDQDGKPHSLNIENNTIQQFIDWAIKNDIKFLESEKRMYSEKLWVAGTADFIFEKDSKVYIGDIKTYKKLWDRTPMLQCAGYGLMYEEMTNKKVDGYVIIRMKDEEFEDKWGYDVEGDTEVFLSALKLFKTLENWN